MPTKTNKKIKSVRKFADETQDQNAVEARERYSLVLPKQALKVEKQQHNNRSTYIEIEDLE
jgi:hypothetical protein